MKTSRWLRLSLGLNLLLAAALAFAAWPRATSGRPPAALAHLTNRPLRVTEITHEPAPMVVEVTPAFHWRELESTDFRVYMANLRAIGCPEDTVRDLLVAEVKDLFDRRLAAIVARLDPRLWELLLDRERFETEAEPVGEDIKAVDKEREAVFQALFGETNPKTSAQRADREAEQTCRTARLLDFLSEGKRQQVLELQARTETASEALRRAARSGGSQDVSRQLRELKEAEERALRQVLSPEEYAEWQLRRSGAAAGCAELGDFRTRDETEVRTLTRILHEQQQALGRLKNKDPDAKTRRAEIQQQTDAQLRQLLGDERLAELRQAQNADYERTRRVTERFGLPAETAAQAWEMQRQAAAFARQAQADAALSVETRPAALQALRAETERSLNDLLGPRAFKAYQEHQGDWLQSLNEVPAPR